jgi:tellurite resistance protein TerC
MVVTSGIWAITAAILAFLVILDFVTVSKTPHEVKFREAASWSVFYILVALAFGGFVWWEFGSRFGTEYFAAYLVEKSLSVDNLFVFAIILAQFAVPVIHHQRVLLFGVLMALVMRGAFIAVGAAAIESFAVTFALFGAILIWTGIKLFQHWDEDPDPTENKTVAIARKFIPISENFDGANLFTRINGKRYATPMFLVLVSIASTDILFALDSIPATFGVTQEPFLVFTANAFALLGLRALFFMLQGLLDKLVYLSIGLAVILMFIGAKLIITFAAHEGWTSFKIPIPFSLGVIGAILLVSTIASFIKVRKDPEAHAHAGRLTDPKPEAE